MPRALPLLALGVALALATRRARGAVVVDPLRVPLRITPLELEEGRRELVEAFEAVAGRAPTEMEARMLTAHSALETGNFQKLRNFNFGNLVELARARPYYVSPSGRTWRAFETAQAGARAFVELLARRYAEAFALLGSGDASAYAHALKARGYFEEPADYYARALEARYA